MKIELEGTFPLPEAQLDRFFMKIGLGYPDEDDEDAILVLEALEPVITGDEDRTRRHLPSARAATRPLLHEDRSRLPGRRRRRCDPRPRSIRAGDYRR